ncbi:MAG: TonB-dependent receptor [Alphaproteobacteria bacterium]|nr:TonB-dependent receptor [Alphaproteobacteria bacterium]
MHHMPLRVLLLAAASATVMSNASFAADAVKEEEAKAGQIEKVVVTAQRRKENVQKVPVAITAIGGDQLESRSIQSFEDLGARVPSLRFGAGVTGGENVITMRGLGSQNTTNGGEAPVAYSVDGIYLQRTTAVDPEFYDIERIEVLRGPQGTLYGRNSVGGSVNVITRKPSDEFSAGFDALIGDYSARIFRGYATGALIDEGEFKVMGRITAVSSEHDPYATNLSTKPTATHNQDAEDMYMLRGQLYFVFSPTVDLQLSASRLDSDGLAASNTAWWQTPTRFMTGPTPITPGSACDFSTKAKFNPRVFCRDAAEVASNVVELYSATLNWDMDWATLTFVNGYASSDVSQTSDGDGSDLPLAIGRRWIMDNEQFSSELRLASNDAESPVQWIGGLYYFWARNYEDFEYEDTGLNDDFSITPAIPDPIFGVGYFDNFIFSSYGTQKTKSWASFGQVDLNLAKTSMDIPLTISAGLRYIDDNKSGFNFFQYQLPSFFGFSTIASGPFDKSWTAVTGKFGLQYQFSDDFMAYASASRGYLSGGNIIGLAQVYNPESVWSYETGFKSNWFDRRLQLNVAAYHADITDLQVFIQSAGASRLDNAGSARARGLEIEAVAIPVENLRLDLTATFTDAEYEEYITQDGRFGIPPAFCTLPGGQCDFAGNSLNQTPPYTVNLGLEYAFVTSIGTFTPRADLFWSGEVFFLPDNIDLARQGPYSRTDLRLTWTDPSEMWRVDAFVKNLEDEDVISNDGLQSISLGQQLLQPDNYVYYPPRTVGLRVGVKFGK